MFEQEKDMNSYQVFGLLICCAKRLSYFPFKKGIQISCEDKHILVSESFFS